MKFSLVFDNSGDTIPFVALNPDVVEYYVDKLLQGNLNNFYAYNSNYAARINDNISELHRNLIESNVWMTELFDQSFKTFDYMDYLDQDNLNYLHAAWVNMQSCRYDIDQKRKESKSTGLPEQIHNMYPDEERFPAFGDVVTKIGEHKTFNRINVPCIHALESSFTKVLFKCSDSWVEFNNPFPKNLINNDICNLYLPFHHLGRTQYNKFVNYDFDLKHADENTFNELLGFVGLSLAHPQTRGYSNEYIDWCKQHNREPSGEDIPLGNIPDLLTNLTKYRIIVFRNTNAGNNFRIELHKG
jgi:hypothetical protein